LHIHYAAAAKPQQPRDHILGSGIDGSCERADRFGRKQRRQGAPLDAPLFVLGFEQAVAQAGPKHALLQRILAVIGGVIDKHTANSGRVVDERNRAKECRPDQYRQLEMSLGPGLDRIAA
jgi:hypothetical protein